MHPGNQPVPETEAISSACAPEIDKPRLGAIGGTVSTTAYGNMATSVPIALFGATGAYFGAP